MKKICLICLCLLGALAMANAAQSAAKTPAKPLGEVPAAVPLWDGSAPMALGNEAADTPVIFPYLAKPAADGAPRSAMLVCPGGGYSGWNWIYEGDFYAHWLNEQGISAFVLRYRLGKRGYRHPVMLTDVSRAMRFIRAHAKAYGIDPARVGVMGSSAGGHLAGTLLTHFDAGKPDAADPVERESSRPSLGVLMYPVIMMDDPYAHKGSRANLLGENPDPKQAEDMSLEKQVKRDTPPTFIVHSRADDIVPAMNSLKFAEALDANKVPYELHVYDLGKHGFGMGPKHEWLPDQRYPWAAECERWLKQQGFVAAPKAAPAPVSAQAP